MALLPILTDDDASPEARVAFEHSKRMFGRVANALRVAAHSPKLAQVIFGFIVAGLREEVTEILDLQTKTLVILKTSMLNGCDYCIGHNTTLGHAAGLSDDQIEAIDGDYQGSPLFTPAQKAAIAWAEYLTERTYRQHPEAMPELKKHYSDAQIVEITMVSGFFNFWNRFNDGLQIDPEGTQITNLFKKSTKIDPADYVEYMRSCWWNDPDAATAKTAAPSAAAGE